MMMGGAFMPPGPPFMMGGPPLMPQPPPPAALSGGGPVGTVVDREERRFMCVGRVPRARAESVVSARIGVAEAWVKEECVRTSLPAFPALLQDPQSFVADDQRVAEGERAVAVFWGSSYSATPSCRLPPPHTHRQTCSAPLRRTASSTTRPWRKTRRRARAAASALSCTSTSRARRCVLLLAARSLLAVASSLAASVDCRLCSLLRPRWSTGALSTCLWPSVGTLAARRVVEGEEEGPVP